MRHWIYDPYIKDVHFQQSHSDSYGSVRTAQTHIGTTSFWALRKSRPSLTKVVTKLLHEIHWMSHSHKLTMMFLITNPHFLQKKGRHEMCKSWFGKINVQTVQIRIRKINRHTNTLCAWFLQPSLGATTTSCHYEPTRATGTHTPNSNPSNGRNEATRVLLPPRPYKKKNKKEGKTKENTHTHTHTTQCTRSHSRRTSHTFSTHVFGETIEKSSVVLMDAFRYLHICGYLHVNLGMR